MLYLDTSVLVSSHTNEARTSDMQIWLSLQGTGQLTVSEWAITEFSSALSMKQRSGIITAEFRQAALAQFAQECADTFRVLPISSANYLAAARYCENVELGLRSGDALHLAICAYNRGSLCTLDQRFAKAALAVGVAVVRL
jgi:uncharacterized protein